MTVTAEDNIIKRDRLLSGLVPPLTSSQEQYKSELEALLPPAPEVTPPEVVWPTEPS